MTIPRLALALAFSTAALFLAGCDRAPETEDTNLTGRSGEDGLPSGTGTGEGARSGGTGTGLSGAGLMQEPAQ